MHPNPQRGWPNLPAKPGTGREEALALATMLGGSGRKPVGKAQGASIEARGGKGGGLCGSRRGGWRWGQLTKRGSKAGTNTPRTGSSTQTLGSWRGGRCRRAHIAQNDGRCDAPDPKIVALLLGKLSRPNPILGGPGRCNRTN